MYKILLLLGLSAAEAFSPSAPQLLSPSITRISTSRPFLGLRCTADVSAGQAAKADFIKLIKSGPKNGAGASDEFVAQVAAAADGLAPFNPTPSPATANDIFDGDWDLLFTMGKGPGSGKVGPFVGEVTQLMVAKDQKYYNTVSLGGGILEITLSGGWEPTGAKDVEVVFDDIKFCLFGKQLTRKEFPKEGRDEVLTGLANQAGEKAEEQSSGNRGFWDMVYLDDDLRLQWDWGVGKSRAEAKLYVLNPKP